MTKFIPKVFTSYAHDTPEHELAVLNFCNDLLENWIDCTCDQYVEDGNPERGWPNWMEENIRESNFVLVVASKKYLERYENKEKDGSGLGAKWEATLTSTEIYQNDFKNMKFIPVLLKADDKQYIPTFLQQFTHYDLSDIGQVEALHKRLKRENVSIKPALGVKKKITDINSLTAIIGRDHEESVLPKLPEFTDDMKPGMKILQAYFVLPLTTRFKIASDLNLVEQGETFENNNAEELTGKFLVRAKERNLLSDLWSKLFNEKIEPNPFKN
ncbi:SEFIR domain-containing protein [uncultured Mucilaginibacter sp.]|uniref:SEFIR domain-containing protein n=1 Tax=uncultured Mucilaginibacter sp. TaxID=797541 RepID=UPI0025DE4B86|nr:SEFIR domain-containing protein [uncultured Mucilaginibacter sp.]